MGNTPCPYCGTTSVIHPVDAATCALFDRQRLPEGALSDARGKTEEMLRRLPLTASEIRALRTLLTATASAAACWIPLSERRPETIDDVLWLEQNEFSGELRARVLCGDSSARNCTHWMPLPELPAADAEAR